MIQLDIPEDAWCPRCDTAEHLAPHTTGITLGAPDIDGMPDPDGFNEHVIVLCSQCTPEGVA